MKSEMEYNKEKKKALGAFYTPQILSDLLARLLVPLIKEQDGPSFTALDPATGDSILLESIERIAQKKKMNVSLIGVDIDGTAIGKSRSRFKGQDIRNTFIKTDSLYPYGSTSPAKGWSKIIKRYIPNGIDLIVSNPPWGADISHYGTLARDFKTAIGQFDIYDLFIETIIANLKPEGVFGIIVPDSIYCQEHQNIRKMLLSDTSIKGIIRLGEGFFQDVNFAVSIIYGIKKPCIKHNILCTHLSNSEKKAVLSGDADIYTIVKGRAIKVPAKQMITANYSFTVDANQEDMPVLQKLKRCNTVKAFTSCQRGVELSKKGVVLKCPQCQEWFPAPRNKKETTFCPHCKTEVDIKDAKHSCIITNKKEKDNVPLITGEDIGRFSVSTGKYIKQGLKGIKYKSAALYKGTKVVVRKTGVGITAGIDYNNSLTNQVVYIVKPNKSQNPLITVELIAAILCSRVITYVIIKEKGSIGWTSNPYLSQNDINMFPFPNLDFENPKTVSALIRITELVRKAFKERKGLTDRADAEIERNVAFLYDLGYSEYRVIFNAIRQTEKMIPFRRLLNINTEDIFQNGI